MSEQQDNLEKANLTQVNSELRASLKRCRILLEKCRSNLAANSNEPEATNDDQEQEAAAD
jgi:hypothetical protein